jgi:hypothetical protein
MAITAFPSLAPTARAWTPGVQPVTNFTSMSGYEVRVMLGADPIGTSLSLTFENLKEASIKQITDHFTLAKGVYEVFSLPAAVFAGMSTYSQVTPSGQSWRYAAAPSISWVGPGVGSVSVELVAVRD